MASTFSANLGLVEPTPGDPSVTNAWGTLLNTDMSLIDSAVAGILTLDVSGSSNVVLSSNQGQPDQSRNQHFEFTGTLNGNINVIWPQDKSRMFSVKNSTSGAFTLSIGANNGSGAPAGSTVAVPQGTILQLVSDGTNVVVRTAQNSAPSGAAGGDLGGSYPNPTVTQTHLTNPLPIAQGGTAAATAAAALTSLGAAGTGTTNTFVKPQLVQDPSNTDSPLLTVEKTGSTPYPDNTHPLLDLRSAFAANDYVFMRFNNSGVINDFGIYPDGMKLRINVSGTPVDAMRWTSAGGTEIGTPTGGSKGAGSLNVQNGIFSNGTAVALSGGNISQFVNNSGYIVASDTFSWEVKLSSPTQAQQNLRTTWGDGIFLVETSTGGPTAIFLVITANGLAGTVSLQGVAGGTFLLADALTVAVSAGQTFEFIWKLKKD